VSVVDITPALDITPVPDYATAPESALAAEGGTPGLAARTHLPCLPPRPRLGVHAPPHHLQLQPQR